MAHLPSNVDDLGGLISPLRGEVFDNITMTSVDGSVLPHDPSLMRGTLSSSVDTIGSYCDGNDLYFCHEGVDYFETILSEMHAGNGRKKCCGVSRACFVQKMKSSLCLRYYAEACSEWWGPSLRLSAWEKQETSLWWRAVGDTVNLIGPGFKPETYRADSDVFNILPTIKSK